MEKAAGILISSLQAQGVTHWDELSSMPLGQCQWDMLHRKGEQLSQAYIEKWRQNPTLCPTECLLDPIPSVARWWAL